MDKLSPDWVFIIGVFCGWFLSMLAIVISIGRKR